MTGSLTGRVEFESPATRGLAIAAYTTLGSAMAWSDGGQIWTATYQGDVAPRTPQPIGSAIKSPYTPTLAFLSENAALYIAWVDETGNVNVSRSADGWDPERFFKIGFGSTGSPAMTHVPGTIYVSWLWENMIQIRSFAPDYNAVPDDPQTGLSANGVWQLNGDTGVICDNGEHGLFALDGKVYVTTGGSVETGAAAKVYVAAGGQWFTEVPIPAIQCFGALQMAFVNGTYHLLWVDAASRMITHAATNDLSSFTGTSLGERSRGGVALVGTPTDLVVGWPWEPAVNGSQHFVAFAKLPLEGGVEAEAEAVSRLASTRTRRALAHDCGPFAVYDDENGECVARSSSRGMCILTSIGRDGFINPISLAICLLRS